MAQAPATLRVAIHDTVVQIPWETRGRVSHRRSSAAHFVAVLNANRTRLPVRPLSRQQIVRAWAQRRPSHTVFF